MPEDGVGKYGIVRGGQYGKPHRKRQRSTAELTLDRELHTAFCAIQGADGYVPSRGIYAIRQKDQHPWRVLAKRCRECFEAGVPLDQVLGIFTVFTEWVRNDLYRAPNHRPPRAA